MSNDISLNTFPNNKTAALTMLYLQNQDLSKLTPGELLEKYYEVYKAIQIKDKELRSNQKQSTWF